MIFFCLPWETKLSKCTALWGTLFIASIILLTTGLQLDQAIAESNYSQPYILPLNSKLGSLKEDVLSSNEIGPSKTKSDQNIDGSYNKFQANPGIGAWSDFEALGGVNRDNSDPAIIANTGLLSHFISSPFPARHLKSAGNHNLSIFLTAWSDMSITADIPRQLNLSIEFNKIPILIPVSVSKLHLWNSLAWI